MYEGKCLEKQPEGCWGFIYLITNITTGKIYVGKKQFTHKKKTRLSKKARKGTRKRIKIEQVDSQWLNYWSSSKELQEDVLQLGEKAFKREILMLCKNKAELSYYEGFYMYHYKVLFVSSYNKWIMVRVYKNNLYVKDKM